MKLRQDVRFEKVAFSYEAAHPVLQAFELRIGAGETVCLLGPSGIGKSTLLHLLLRLYDVDGGRRGATAGEVGAAGGLVPRSLDGA